MPSYSGTCHCGRVTFSIETENALSDLYRCNCSLCTRKAIIMKPVHQDDFSLTSGQDALSCYKWHTGKAEHFFCSECGVYTHHRRRTAPDQISINVGCLTGVPQPAEDQIGLVDGAGLD
ncbi:GFA family protein [Pyruvatibacter mobilis]|jgi:hypothetical protein|uniref:GFA family protein n=1 Tax=Pyruvatibacter mobilis TaxID=1712261 RepID=UPI003BAAF486